MLFWSKIHVQISLHFTHLQKTMVSCWAFSYLFLLTQMCDFPPFSCPTIYFTTTASPYEALFPLHTTQGCPLPQPPQPALGRKQGRKGTQNHSPSLLIWSHHLLIQDTHTMGLKADLEPALHPSSTQKRECRRHHSCVLVTKAFCMQGNLWHFMQ